MQRLSLREWIKAFIEGRFESTNRKTQIEAGWNDWFCKDSSLKAKTYKLGGVVKQIKEGGKVDLDNTYVFFKNNCPLNGPLYDDFRICDISNGNVQFTIQFDCCWNKSKYVVYGKTADDVFHSDEPIFESDFRKKLVAFLNTPWEVK